MDKISGVTQYKGFTKFYFLRILYKIIQIGNLSKTNSKILDFGCGLGLLKEILGAHKVINFDILPALTDVEDWKTTKFDILVANQVFCTFKKNNLEVLLKDLRDHNPDLTLIVGISKRGFLNKIGMLLSGRQDAHDSTVLDYDEEMLIYSEAGLNVLERVNVFYLCDILKMSFKNKENDH